MLVKINLEGVPGYLRSSSYFETLTENSEEGEDEFEVPARLLKQTAIVNSKQDLLELLSTLQFWGANECPQELIHFIFNNKNRSYETILRENCFVANIRHVLATRRQPVPLRVTHAVNSGKCEIVRYLYVNGYGWDPISASLAPDRNNLSCLKFAVEHGAPWSNGMLEESVQRGNMECLQFARENGCRWSSEKVDSEGSAPRYRSRPLCQRSLREWSGERRPIHRHFECFKYALQHGADISSSNICNTAALHGHLACLRHAHEQGAPWSAETALCCSSLDCLRYCVEKGCPYDASAALSSSAGRGDIDSAAYLLQLGARWGGEALLRAVVSNEIEFLRFALSHGASLQDSDLCCIAVCERNLEMLRFLHEQDCPWDAETTYHAALNGFLEALRYLHEHDCPWTMVAYVGALANNQWACCDFLKQHGCPLPWSDALDAAVRLLCRVFKARRVLRWYGWFV